VDRGFFFSCFTAYVALPQQSVVINGIRMTVVTFFPLRSHGGKQFSFHRFQYHTASAGSTGGKYHSVYNCETAASNIVTTKMQKTFVRSGTAALEETPTLHLALPPL
jgi:hypothetical protein